MKKKLKLPLLLFLLITACRKDQPADTPPAATEQTSYSLTLAEAKEWFVLQKDTSGISLQSTQKTFNLSRLNVSWDQVQAVQTDTSDYLLAHLPGQPTFQNIKQGYRKLVFKRGAKGGIEALLLEIIPDALYIQRARTVDPATFTGRVFIYDRNYQLKSGLLFINGKQAGAIRPQDKTPQSAPDRMQTNLVQVVENCTWFDNNYINADGEVVVYSERICTYDITDSGGMGGGGGGPVYAGSGGGGGGTSATSPPVSNLPGETNPAINPKSYIDCFSNIPDAGAKMKVTVYVQEPFPGTTFNYGPNSVGHTAISLNKTNGSSNITQTLGFYPNASGKDKMLAPSKLVDNSGTSYDVGITYTVSKDQFAKILSYIANPPKIYDLTEFNCTNFVISACQAGSIILPDATNTVGLQGPPGGAITAMTPAGLGANIEKLNGPNVNKTGGTMPISKGPCK